MSESSPPPGLQAALDYAARGLDVLPMHTRTERGCSCGNPACDSPGKHPRVRDWGNAATRDPAVIEQRWRTWPGANVGIRTGKLTDGRYLVVLDVDGDEGSDALAELERQHGELPPTVSATTRRGQHYYFLSPVEFRNSASALAPGLDVRAEGGCVVAPPGEGRAWDVPLGEQEPAELPDWLGALLEGLERPVQNGSRPGSSPDPIPHGRRDDTLISLAGTMRRPGMSPAAIEAALMVENVARCKPPLPEAAVRRIAASGARYEPARDGGPAGDAITARAFSTIRPERVEWLTGWEGRIPVGMLTLLTGDPGLGKSLATVRMAAEVSRSGHAALLLTAEDSPAVTVRPRLEAAGADLARVLVVEAQRDGVPTGLALPDDAAALARLVGEHEARLVVVDPLMAHLPAEVNSWRDQSVRGALAPLFRLADEHRCAVVIVAHLNKSSGTDALHRTGGTIGIPAAARSALLLARDPDDPEGESGSRRVLAHAKTNVSLLAPSRLYAVEPAVVADIETARLRHLGESEAGAGALLSHGGDGERTATDDAADFLADELADGDWHESGPVKARAKAAGHSSKVVRRARERLRIEDDRRGFPAVSVWRLPVVPSPSDREGTTEEGTTAQSQSESGNEADPPSSRALSQIEGTTEDERLATPEEEADAERVRRKFGAELEADDDLSDLGPEQPLPSRTPKVRDAEPCGCDRPLSDGESGCFQCGRALAGESS